MLACLEAGGDVGLTLSAARLFLRRVQPSSACDRLLRGFCEAYCVDTSMEVSPSTSAPLLVSQHAPGASRANKAAKETVPCSKNVSQPNAVPTLQHMCRIAVRRALMDNTLSTATLTDHLSESAVDFVAYNSPERLPVLAQHSAMAMVSELRLLPRSKSSSGDNPTT